MLEPKQHAGATDCQVQSFAVRYDYPVYFTRDAFEPDNPGQGHVLARGENARRQRVAVFVDEGVTFAIPDLLPRIARYAHQHPGRIEIAGEAVVVPGGEAVKNNHDCVEQMLRE